MYDIVTVINHVPKSSVTQAMERCQQQLQMTDNLGLYGLLGCILKMSKKWDNLA